MKLNIHKIKAANEAVNDLEFAKLDDTELESVSGGVDSSHDGYPCHYCKSHNTHWKESRTWRSRPIVILKCSDCHLDTILYVD